MKLFACKFDRYHYSFEKDYIAITSPRGRRLVVRNSKLRASDLELFHRFNQKMMEIDKRGQFVNTHGVLFDIDLTLEEMNQFKQLFDNQKR